MIVAEFDPFCSETLQDYWTNKKWSITMTNALGETTVLFQILIGLNLYYLC